MDAGPVPPSSGERPLRSISSSMGNERTSVGPSLSRNRSLRAAMAGSSTKSRDTSVSAVTPSAPSTGAGQLGPPLDGHRVVGLLVGGVDVEAHRGAPADRRGRGPCGAPSSPAVS